VVVLAVGNKVEFYGSTNLKEWEFLSEFGANPEVGAHTGVWECPDLIPFMIGNEQVWVLFVSINPGGIQLMIC
jgi:fructan beta-fructosidase